MAQQPNVTAYRRCKEYPKGHVCLGVVYSRGRSGWPYHTRRFQFAVHSETNVFIGVGRCNRYDGVASMVRWVRGCILPVPLLGILCPSHPVGSSESQPSDCSEQVPLGSTQLAGEAEVAQQPNVTAYRRCK